MKTANYLLPDFWASPLINDDWTGLSDEDEAHLTLWLKATKPGYCIDVSDESEFVTGHDARGYVLPCDCLTYTFQELPV
jgi:hypothetical protein